MKTIYQWFTLTAVRSWYAHFLVCLLVAVAAGWLADWLGYLALRWMQLAATAACAFYLLKEAGDEVRYRRKGTFKKRHWADRVKAETDRGGDALGPIAVCATLWAIELIDKLR